MILSPKKLIIFDLDGTLIDSVPDLAAAVNHMLTELGYRAYDEHLIRLWVGNGAQTLVKRALSGSVTIDETIDETHFMQALNIFLTHYSKNLALHTKAYENVVTTLQQLQKRGYRLAIVTNKPVEFVSPILEALSLQQYFEYFIGGDSLPERKPHPMPLLHVCEKLGTTVDEAVMIGDSKNDLLAANAAHMQSIGVTYGYNYDEEISVYDPDIIVDDFAELLKYLVK